MEGVEGKQNLYVGRRRGTDPLWREKKGNNLHEGIRRGP